MIGLVNADNQLLEDICIRIHVALEQSSAKYVADRYSILLYNSEDNLYALRIVQMPAEWNDVIMGTLTEQEKEMMQDISNDYIIPEL